MQDVEPFRPERSQEQACEGGRGLPDSCQVTGCIARGSRHVVPVVQAGCTRRTCVVQPEADAPLVHRERLQGPATSLIADVKVHRAIMFM
jgi:hypothetical protein